MRGRQGYLWEDGIAREECLAALDVLPSKPHQSRCSRGIQTQTDVRLGLKSIRPVGASSSIVGMFCTLLNWNPIRGTIRCIAMGTVWQSTIKESTLENDTMRSEDSDIGDSIWRKGSRLTLADSGSMMRVIIRVHVEASSLFTGSDLVYLCWTI
jgi:hypothetical protein